MKTTALLLAALALCACSGRDSGSKDSTLARDLALANQAQSAQPQFQDTSASQPTANQTRAKSRIENPPRTRTRTVPRTTATTTVTTTSQTGTAPAREIAAGAGIVLASQSRICTTSNRPGDRFVGTVTSPVVGSNGAIVPAGSSVILDVASVASDNSSLTLRVVSVEFNGMSYAVSGDATTSQLERTKIVTDQNADKKKVIGGAIVGAIIGQMIGHNTKGTVIGAATGAAGGAVAAKVTEKYEACLPVGGTIRVTTSQPIVL